MMKKSGFTLAEVLITIGLIGVVAALTMPTLSQNTKVQKVGPILAKSVSAFEQANAAMLNDKEADSITGAYSTSISNYMNGLTDHLKGESGTVANRNTIFSTDGVQYIFDFDAFVTGDTSTVPHKRLISSTTTGGVTNPSYVIIDINGNAGPNEDGKDKFYFTLWDDGTLKPVGGHGWNGDNFNPVNHLYDNANNCPNGAKPTNAKYCTGSIFENGLKVMYK